MSDITAPGRAFVRTELVAPAPPPATSTGVVGWIWMRLFGGWLNTLLTVASLYLIWRIVPPVLDFLIFDAVWTGSSRDDCLAEQIGREVGACWPFIRAKFTQLVYGFYPWEEHWRVDLTFALGAALLVPLLIPRVPYKGLNAILFFGVYPFVAFFLLVGGKMSMFALGLTAATVELVLDGIAGMGALPVVGPLLITIAYLLAIVTWPFRALLGALDWGPGPLWNDVILTGITACAVVWYATRRSGAAERRRALLITLAAMLAIVLVIKALGADTGRLPYVETRAWGGLLVTLVVAVTGIVASLPLGIMLALGRRSRLPVVRFLSVVFIEFWRGVPLITVLFFATYMLPLFLPNNWSIDSLLRALVGVALFSAAYMAEVVRGGLQAIPRGQYEGAMALGLGYWRMMGLIVLPQALKLVIPGIVNTFIGLFKDTTLVLIVSIFDFLGQLRAAFADPNWSTPVTLFTGFAFAGLVYFAFCFGMSRYSLFIERRLNVQRR